MRQGTRTILTDTHALSRGGHEALDAALTPLGEGARAAYWASVRKCYNAPYEEDGHRRRAQAAPDALPDGAPLPACATPPEGFGTRAQPVPL